MGLFHLVFAMLSCLFRAALWPHAGKGLTSWLTCDVFLFICHFPCILGQVWYLIVSIPDLGRLPYLKEWLKFQRPIIGSDPLKNHKATKPDFNHWAIIGTPAKRHLNGVSLADR